LKTITEAEPYNRGNPYILTGYRVNYSLKLTLRSLLFLHNEWTNVWTHLSALIGFFFLMIYAYSTWLADGTISDKVMFLIWVISAQTLLFSSTFFHLTECMGPKMWLLGVRMDYTSISVLIVGSYFPMIHYLFGCNAGWQYFYIGLMLTLGVVVVSISMSNYFQRPEFQALRASLYVAMGLFGVLCAPHVYLMYSSEELQGLVPMCLRLILMGGTYISGAYIYASKVPEKWFPGRFDYWFGSHMIWHIFVVAATLWHYSAVYEAHQWRLDHPCK
jgi:adiponectin receptor